MSKDRKNQKTSSGESSRHKRSVRSVNAPKRGDVAGVPKKGSVVMRDVVIPPSFKPKPHIPNQQKPKTGKSGKN